MEPPSATDNSQPSASPRSAQRVIACSNSKDDAETGPADGFLFPPEDLIYSVLDLTRELEKRGVIEILQQANGGDCYRIVDRYQSFKVKQPTGDLVQRVGAIFRRRRSTLWSSDEIKAFKVLTIDPGDLSV